MSYVPLKSLAIVLFGWPFVGSASVSDKNESAKSLLYKRSANIGLPLPSDRAKRVQF